MGIKNNKGEGEREDPKRKKKLIIISLLLTLKPVQRVLLVFLGATGRGALGFAFLHSFGSERMGTRFESQYSVSQPPAQVFHELPGSNQPLSDPQRESISSAAPKTSRAHNSPPPLTLGVHS